MDEAGEAGADEARVGLRPLHPAVRRLWWLEASVLALALMLGVALVILQLPRLPIPAAALLLIIGALALGAAGAVPALRYRRWGYRLRDGDLWLRRGVLWVTTTVVPLQRLQFVDTRQGPLERLFGLTRLVLYTAAPGTSAELPGLQDGEAERLRDQLGRVDADAAGV